MNTTKVIDHYFTSFEPAKKLPRGSMGVFTFLLKLELWMRTARSRRQLAELSDEQLKDIGICHADAIIESKRPFYDI